jgi:Tol biopolymer transport system component
MTELAGKDLSRLGDLSLESSQGIPWMLNRYAERTSEKNWSEHWSSWVSRARARAQTDLKTIREAGLTEVAPLTQGNYSSLGVAFSADGRWLAYSREALDRRQGVYLRELASGREIRVSDQLGGASMAFTRDSSALVFSRVDRNGLYDFFSDLWLYDLAHEKLSRLSWGKRLRDPSLSQVDDRMVFTKNESGRTVLASGVLERTEAGEYHLREIQELFRPALLGRVSTPRLSPDGSKIVFSLHENGKVGESLYECRSECRQITSEGAYFDRFPFFDRDGRLYFVSNRSGVDNVYRWNSREHASALTNVSTAVWLPAFSPSGRLAASYYRDTGWDLAWVALNESARAPQVLPFGPEVVQASSGTSSSSSDTPIPSSWRLADYRVYPSILPRSWGPYFSYASGTGWSLGAVLLGFDALDFHRYMAQLEFHSGLSEADVDLRYSNRLLGVVWSLRGASQVASLYEATYSRRLLAETGLSLYYPRTFSAWNPALYFGYEKETEYAYPDRRSELGSGVLSTLIYSPVVKAELSYWGTQSSRQSIWPEEGMNVRLGNQWTLGGWLGSRDGVPLSVTQFLWTQSHFWHLGRHVVLSPNWQVSTSNRSSVRLEGRANTWLNSLPGSDFDGLGIRGYPLQGFFTKQAGVFALDLRFPIRRVERGWSTYPVFLRTIEAMSFIETSIKRPSQLAAWTPLPAWGLGLRSGLTLFYSVPVTASVQFHQGTRGSLGGKGEAFVDVQLGQLSF